MVERGDAVDDVEGRVPEGQVLAVGLDPREVAVEGAAPEPDLRVGEDVGGDVLAAALEPEAGRPRLRGAELEHAQPAALLDEAVEEHPDRVAVRPPVEVVPPELLVHERQHGVDGVVRLVPRLGSGLLHPPGCFRELRRGSGEVTVEHQGDPVLDGEGATALRAREQTVGRGERRATERATKELE